MQMSNIILEAIKYMRRANRVVTNCELRAWYNNYNEEYDFHYFLTRLILSERIKKEQDGYILP